MTLLSPSTIPARGVLTISGRREERVEGGLDRHQRRRRSSPASRSPPATSSRRRPPPPPTPSSGTGSPTPSTQVLVGDLAPRPGGHLHDARCAPTTLAITGDPGVYWIGVHALGDQPGGPRPGGRRPRAHVHPARARKSLARLRTVPLSVVLPVRDRARRGGRRQPQRPRPLGAPHRARGSPVPARRTSAPRPGPRPLTWVVDPAVLDALQDFGRGNPPLSLGPATGRAGARGRRPGDDQQPDSSPSPSPSPRTESRRTPSEEQRDRGERRAEHAADRRCASHPALALRVRRPRRRRARPTRTQPAAPGRRRSPPSSMQAHNLTGSPVVAPPRGLLRPRPARPASPRAR